MTLLRPRFLPVLTVIGAWLWIFPAWIAQAHAETALPDVFAGSFRGIVSGTAGTPNGDFTLAIERSGDGFAVRWPPRRSVAFRPTARPGVFRSDRDANPLAGETAYWARFDGTSLIVYSMQIDAQGGYDIQNYRYVPTDGGLDLVVWRVRAGAQPAESKGSLEKYGR